MFHGLTIDPPGTRDRDDAISLRFEGPSLVAEIAFPDLTGPVPAESAHDIAARETGMTVYGRAGVAKAMLPAAITEQGSLDPGPPSPVFVIRIRLARDGAILGTDLRRDRFTSKGCYTYSQASEIIRSGKEGEIPLASQLAEILYRRRVAEGALVHYDLQRGAITNEEGSVRYVDVAGVRGEILIAEFMILANRCLAEMAAVNGLPILYRNHRARPAASRDDLIADLAHQDPQAFTRQAMVLERATLEPISAGHYGLNLPGYAWFTSPLRRYADLVNQRALGCWLDKRPAPRTDLAAVGRHLTDLIHRRADEKSAYLKGQAKDQHLTLLSSDLTRVKDEVLAKVIELAQRTQTLPPSLVAEILRRLPAGRFTLGMLFDTLRLSPELATAALAHLAMRPHDTMSLLGHARNLLAWPDILYEEDRQGPDQALIFTVVARLSLDGVTHVSGAAVDHTLKAARNRAVMGLFAAVYGGAPPEMISPLAASQISKTTTAKPKPTTSLPGNAKSVLNEICQRNRWPVPDYRTDRSGPDHAPVFTCVARIITDRGAVSSRPATGSNRKDAEQNAAAAWMSEHSTSR